jgi:hypothetical protein
VNKPEIEPRLESLAPSNIDDARARAVLAARVTTSRKPLLAIRGTGLRRLSFAGALAALAAALVVAVGTGGGSGISAEAAAAAELTELAGRSPHIAITGHWEITNTELTAEGGSTSYHYERAAQQVHGSADTTVSWYRGVSIDEVGARLQAAGLTPAGTLPYSTLDGVKAREGGWDSIFTTGIAQVYTSPAGEGWVNAVGVWQQDGWTFSLSARVGTDLYMEERLLERVEFLGPNEWAIALRPGGQKWLVEHFDEKVGSFEQVKVEGPDGTFVYEIRARKDSRKKAPGAPMGGISPE